MYNLEDVIYMAGFFDGEGCISIFRSNTSRGPRRGFGLLIQVSNTNEGVVRWMQTTFGGTCYEGKRYKTNCAVQWKWHLCGKAAEEVIRAIHPYLKIKGPEADVAIRFMISKRLSCQGRRSVPAHIIAEREALLQELKVAKRAYKKYG